MSDSGHIATSCREALEAIYEGTAMGPGKMAYMSRADIHKLAGMALSTQSATLTASGETPIRDAWYCPPGVDGPIRLKFNRFLDEVVAPLERELAALKASQSAMVSIPEHLVSDMDEAVLDTDASGRPVAHLYDTWLRLKEALSQ